MYLSLLTLNPRSRQVQSELARPYEMHRTILSGFKGRPLVDTERVLFRLDQHAATNALTILVQSLSEPDWAALETKKDGANQPYLLQRAQTKSVNWADKLEAGQKLAFRLRANPTKRLPLPDGERADGKRGKRVGLYREEDQQNWLIRHAEAGGFRMLQHTVSKDGTQRDTAKDLSLFTVQFDGVLEVIDKGRFVETLEAGIGSAKGFGCGLLSLAPA
jgi:CRISPR system Cascade subunit CasE